MPNTLMLPLRPAAIPLVLGVVAATFISLNVLWRLAWPEIDPDTASAVVYRLIDLDGEANIPAWFSSAMWLFVAALAASLSTRSSDHSRQWRGVFVLCSFLSLDEMAQLHEAAGLLLKAAFPAMRVYQRAWIFAGGALVFAATLFFAPLLRSLKPTFGAGIAIAGVVFVTGAIGFELLGTAAARGTLSWYPPEVAWTTVVLEEGLEMFGVIIFIWMLLKIASDEQPYRLAEVVAGDHDT